MEGSGCRIIPVAGGKGGVGKTTVSVHLARFLAEHGNVLVADLDPLPNADEFLKPIIGSRRVEVAPGLWIYPTREHGNLFMVKGEIGADPTARYLQIAETALNVQGLDYVILDMGAGLDSVRVFSEFNVGVMVLWPEKASFRDAEVYLRKCVVEKMVKELRVAFGRNADTLFASVIAGEKTVDEVLLSLGDRPGAHFIRRVVYKVSSEFTVHPILNGTGSQADLAMANEFMRRSAGYYHIGVKEPVQIPLDERLNQAVKQGRLLWPLPPGLALAFSTVATSVLQDERFAGGNRTVFGRIWSGLRSAMSSMASTGVRSSGEPVYS